MEYILILIIIITCISAVFVPWLGVIAYYTLAIFTPQNIWPWIFEDYRVSLYIAISTVVGIVIKWMIDELNYSPIFSLQSKLVLSLFVLVHLSNFMSPYYGTIAPQKLQPEFVLAIFNKIIFFFYAALLVIDTRKKLNYLIYVLIVSGVYYIYWANHAYLSGMMWQFSDNGRLNGPGSYQDENAFAIMFIVTLPFIFYFFNNQKVKLLWALMFLIIPLSWHAIFLTASRGALLSLIISTFYFTLRFQQKTIKLLIVLFLAVMLIWQGGNLYSRTITTAQKSAKVEKVEEINPRFVTWIAGLKMARDNPLFGVGVERFQQHGVIYIDGRVQVAHNTMIQFASQTGILSSFLYLWLIYSMFRKKIKTNLSVQQLEILHAIRTALIGFFVCSLFLNLMISEFFYFLILIYILNGSIPKSENLPQENN